MATEQDRRKRGLFLIFGITALFLLAALAGNSGIPWLEAWFAGGAGGGTVASFDGGNTSEVGGGSDASGATASGDGCFLGIICLYANADVGDSNVNASADDDGVDASANN